MSKNFTKRSKALSYQRRCKYKIFLRDDPISAFLFILGLEILFVLIKSKPELKEFSIIATFILHMLMIQHFS